MLKKEAREITGGLSKPVEDARTSSQPASLEVHHRGEAASREGQRLRWLLCPEG